jgi:CBS domain containing-hemolysin-like protein
MIPRTEMVAVPQDADLETILALSTDYPFTKYPVYADDPDHIIGVVHLKDILHSINTNDDEGLLARDLMREAIFIPDTARASTLLPVFRTRRQHIAIVLDEYGGTAGIVTLSDVLEEIVGEVSDPFDQEQDIQALPDGSTLVDGLMLIDEVNEHFDLDLQDPNYDTIAGYMLGHLERLARVGDTVTVDGIRLRVEAMDGFRIARISIVPTVSPQMGGSTAEE